MNVAETIYQQLGGGRFQAMTGAKLFAGGANFLTFRLPANFAAKGITCVRIDLTPADLYDMTFYKVRGTKVTEVANVEAVAADRLGLTFKEQTGLDVSLGLRP